jgi:peroxiredoxin
MSNKVTFNIKVTMNERWVNDFCSMLKWMESCGNLGHSSVVGFYADGDGDFRPKFEFDREFEKTHGIWQHERTDEQGPLPRPEVIFDAG